MASFMERMRMSYNLFKVMGDGFSVAPEDRVTSTMPSPMSGRISYDSSQSVLAPILTRISTDAATVPMRHVMVDRDGRFVTDRKSELNDRLTIMANIDQTGVAFVQDCVRTMLNEGAVALVPVEFNSGDLNDSSLEILSMRAGTITEWHNRSVTVSIYNEIIGDRVEKTLEKSFVAIAYNPFYWIMNDRNSTLRRLIDRLALLDSSDNATFRNQLDLILQIPYTIRNERLTAEAERRRTILEEQLANSKYGVAWIDTNERITQLNRPVNNGLIETVTSLRDELHSQLGLTPNVFSGVASQDEMLSYSNRTIMPIMNALADSMVGAFFSRTAVRQGHRVRPIQNLFKMAPIMQISEAADSFTRNEIMTSNEIRGEIGLKPVQDPQADQLRNKNLNQPAEAVAGSAPPIPAMQPAAPQASPPEEPEEPEEPKEQSK